MVTMATRAKTSKRKKSKKYVVDEKGRRTAVLLPIREYEELIEAAEQVDDIRHLEETEAAGGAPIPLEEVEARLRADGKLR